MDEQTTTTPPVDEGASAQPNEQSTGAAESQQEPTNATDNVETGNQEQPSPDDNLEWLKNKGIDPSSPEAVSKLAEMYRNAEKTMHQSRQQASQLEKTISTENNQAIAEAAASGNVDAAELALAKIAAVEVQMSVNNFFSQNPDAKQYEQAMVELISQRPQVGAMVKSGALGINDLYAMARGNDTHALEEAKTQGGQQALQQLANKQTAATLPGAATTSAMTPPKGDRLMDLWAS
jgi:hypothetical protein